MATILGHAVESGDGTDDRDSSQSELVYQVIDAASHDDAVAAVELVAPATLVNPLGRVLVQGPVSWEATEADDCFIVTVRYVVYQPDEDDSFDYTFDTNGGEATITQAKDHVASYVPAGKTATDHKKAIGVTDSGVEGVSVPAPGFKWTETHVLPLTFANFGYGLILYLLHGHTNNAPFRGFATGTVRFLGGTRVKKDQDNATVTLSFEAGPHASDLDIGNGITVTEKKAWDYIWFEYEEKEDPDSHKVTRIPIAAHVERVADPGDFSLFGVGTAAPPV